MTTTPGIRARNRAAIEQAIIDVARDHLATDGAAALSMRAIARDLQMMPSALYRYVDNRDELLTRLIVEAYDSLAEAVAPTLRSRAAPAKRWVAAAQAIRRWGLTHRHQWALIYGSPVPDYDAPADRTNEAGNRVLLMLVDLVIEHGGAQGGTGIPRAALKAAEELGSQAPLDGRLSPPALLAAMDGWTLIIGAVSREIFSQLGPLPDPEAIFAVSARRSAQIALPDDRAGAVSGAKPM